MISFLGACRLPSASHTGHCHTCFCEHLASAFQTSHLPLLSCKQKSVRNRGLSKAQYLVAAGGGLKLFDGHAGIHSPLLAQLLLMSSQFRDSWT